MIKAIVFDFTNVIYKTDWKKLKIEFLAKTGFNVVLRENEWTDELMTIYTLADIGKEDFRKFFKEINPQIKDLNNISQIYMKIYSENKVLNKSLFKLISKLRKNYSIFGFTDVKKLHYDANKKNKLYRGFKKVFTSFQFGKLKSDKTAFIMLSKELKKYNLLPKECLFIDDNQLNIENAKKVKFKTIIYSDFPKTKKLRRDIYLILNHSRNL